MPTSYTVAADRAAHPLPGFQATLTEPRGPDFEQTARFLTLLDESTERWTFQTFDDNKTRKDPTLARVLHGTLKEHWQVLCDLSSRGAGVFITVNETNGKGRKAADIIRVRAVFQECDRPGTPEPSLQPHIVVESSPGKYHRYWLVDGGHRFDLFEQVMARLVQDFGSDPNAKDRARVLRLPGLHHQKDPARPWMVRVIHESGEQPYLWEQITAAIPPLECSKKASKTPAGTALDDPAKVRSALAALDPDMEYSGWLAIGMALHHATAGGAEGLALWDEWSAGGRSYRPGETAYKWRTFGSGNGQPVTLASIFKMAADTGWKDTPRGNGHDTAPPPDYSDYPEAQGYAKAKGAGPEPRQSQAAESGKPSTRIYERFGIKSMDAILKTLYPDLRWAIEGILPEGLTLLAGPPKVKKSWFALAAAIAVSTGGMALGRVKVEKGRVLYLALEDRERRIQTRAKRILVDGGANPELLDIATTWRRLDDSGLQALREYLVDHPDTRLIIIDTLALVRPRKLKGEDLYEADYRAVSQLKALADQFSTSILVITHTRKQEAEDFLDTVMGTHGVSGAADGLLVLKRARCADTGILSVTGRDIENEREAVLNWDKRSCTWHLTDDDAASMKLTPERRRIVEILRESPTSLSSKQIATALHGREMVDKDDNAWKVTRNLLGRMVTSGTIQQLDNKSYALPASDPPDEELEGDKNTYAPDALYAPYAPDAPYAPEQSGSGAPGQLGSGAQGAQGAYLDTYAPDTSATDGENKEISGGAQGAYGAYLHSAKSSAIDNAPLGSAAPFDPAADSGHWADLVAAAPAGNFEGTESPPPAHATDEHAPHAKYCSDCTRFYPVSLNCGALPGVAIENNTKPPCMGRFFRSMGARP